MIVDCEVKSVLLTNGWVEIDIITYLYSNTIYRHAKTLTNFYELVYLNPI